MLSTRYSFHPAAALRQVFVLRDPRLDVMDLAVGAQRHPIRVLSDNRAREIARDVETVDLHGRCNPAVDSIQEATRASFHLRTVADNEGTCALLRLYVILRISAGNVAY
jgi:hypothetical protein